jgi:hypothetical protein
MYKNVIKENTLNKYEMLKVQENLHTYCDLHINFYKNLILKN